MLSNIKRLCSRFYNWVSRRQRPVTPYWGGVSDILEWYDGPQLVYMTELDYYGNPIAELICVLQKEDWYLGAILTPALKEKFNTGKIDLRSIYESQPLCRVTPELFGYYKIVPIESPIKEEYLPLPGFYLDSEGRVPHNFHRS